MARGRKSYTLDEQLEIITNEIENIENVLKEKKQEQKNILSQIETRNMKELYQYMKDNGKTIDDIKALIDMNVEDCAWNTRYCGFDI